MFDPSYDPMAQLEQLQTQIAVLNSDKVQLATAINHQAHALGLLNKQVAALVEANNQQDQKIKLLQNQLQSINIIAGIK